MKNLAIQSAEDIRALPWAGNHASDMKLFQLCRDYIFQCSDRGEQKHALTLMMRCGMGEEDPATDKELDGYLANES